jgi:pilus assembly protein Flp/PilA
MVLVELSWKITEQLRLRAFPRRSNAQSTVEYALVGALVVIAAAGALTLLGTELSGVFTNISNTLKSAATGH